MPRHALFSSLFLAGLIAAGVLAVTWVGPSVAYTAAQRGEFRTAVRLWRPLAWLGNADAQFNLGLSLEKGRGLPVDIAQSLYWYDRAARNGAAAAQYNLAENFRVGAGVPRDAAQALFWLRKAAQQNYQSAQNNLGMMYAEGNGISKDLVEAAFWFRAAIFNGSESAKVNLANFERQMTAEQIAQAMRRADEWCRRS